MSVTLCSSTVQHAFPFAKLRVKVALEFVPEDCWVGLYWKRSAHRGLDLYLCVVPFFPIHTRIDYISLRRPAEHGSSHGASHG